MAGYNSDGKLWRFSSAERAVLQATLHLTDMDAEGFLLVLLATTVVVSALPAPQSLQLGAGEVGASFGGYSASAGLGGLLGGRGTAAGGLHAEAGTPGGPAAAAGLGGLLAGGGGGGKLYSGATTGSNSYAGAFGGGKITSGGGNKDGGFFDRIFDIPISTLNAVNRLLNEGGSGVAKTRSSVTSRAKVSGVDGHLRSVSKFKVSSKSKQFAAPPPGAYAPQFAAPPPGAYAPQYTAQGGAFASSSSSSSYGGAQAGTHYDRIFDIPVSVLQAVNRFLNQKGP